MESFVFRKNGKIHSVIIGTVSRIQKTGFFRPKYYLIDPDNRIKGIYKLYEEALHNAIPKVNILKIGRTTHVGDFYECRYNRRLGAYVLSKDGKELAFVNDPTEIDLCK